ncbi:MAG: M1 family metallopeptidase [Weeksellaceae bacterium]|nr:M1 family metallopeptidase [Weeksellaceae bacterium]
MPIEFRNYFIPKSFLSIAVSAAMGVSVLISCATQQPTTSSAPHSVGEALEVVHNYSPDQLRGTNSEFRNWWNVLRYDITIAPDYEKRFIDGITDIRFEITGSTKDSILQIDLQQPMQIVEILQITANPSNNQRNVDIALPADAWTRDGNAYFIDFKQFPNKSLKEYDIKIKYSGHPIVAKNAPWDGGWVFARDEKGRPWMSAAVQGLGASSWYPNKDYQGDEPDLGATLSMIVPDELVAIGNGRMWESSFEKGDPGKNVYTWEVVNPINNYNIIPYIGQYVHFQDVYHGMAGELDLHYWVLDYNLEKAKEHFVQVKPMMQAFEDWMGKYPFYEDSYKLVESPYLGMEHQSNVAYGNRYTNGYLGRDTSGTGWGMKFDFIIVHETGHEWFGNSITTEQKADMWVHEGFTTYTEVMYLDYLHGTEAGNAYVQGLRRTIQNKRPLIGTYDVNKSGDSDMYNKGANIIHTLRQLIEDDTKFKQIIRDMNSKYFHSIVTTQNIEDFMSRESGIDLTEFFEQYLRTNKVPVLEVRKQGNDIEFRWNNIITGFDMPVKLQNSEEWIYPKAEWTHYQGSAQKIEPDKNFYINFRQL